jgi:hypothetical protein
MALPTSGTISIGSLRNFFGDTGSSSLSEFYRGSALVPSTESVAVSVPYTYYTTTYENQTTYTTEAQTTYSTVSEYGFDNYSSAQTFWYGNAGRGVWWIIWQGTYKRYLGSYFTSYAHADGWTYSLAQVMYSVPTTAWGGSTTIIGSVNRSTQQATTTYVQVPTTTQVAVQNGPYTGYNTEYQNQNQNTSVATSGSISLSQFYGASN